MTLQVSACQNPILLETMKYRSCFWTIPKDKRITAYDFLFFNWCSNTNPDFYDIIIQTLDTTLCDQWRNLGTLRESVELPPIVFDVRGIVGVVPKSDESLPRFTNTFSRGNTYTIKSPSPCADTGGIFTMQRHGII